MIEFIQLTDVSCAPLEQNESEIDFVVESKVLGRREEEVMKEKSFDTQVYTISPITFFCRTLFESCRVEGVNQCSILVLLEEYTNLLPIELAYDVF